MGRKLRLPPDEIGEQVIDRCLALHHKRERPERVCGFRRLLLRNHLSRGVEENENPCAGWLHRRRGPYRQFALRRRSGKARIAREAR